MFDHFLLTVNQWMTAGSAFAMAGAFAWGMVSVLFSPCRLAAIPLSWPTRAACRPLSTPAEPPGVPAPSPWDFFITIAVVGVVCALLGRMLGDVGAWWQVLVGIAPFNMGI
ncbi:hypothetical protein [Desulfosarcina sp.]|uniref:hypothetical protein n=1 Tax=Desulfosarcina sp. TaxID=2027861 RepID=UPI003970E10E